MKAHPQAQAVLHQVKEWAYATARGEQRSIILWSSGYGKGKTHLARGAYKYVTSWTVSDELGVTTHKRANWFTAPEFFGAIKDCYSQNRPVGALFDDWGRAPLFMDDLGKSYTKDGSEGWAQEQLFRVVDRLVNSGNGIFITSNLAPAGMEQILGGAAWSRVLGMLPSRAAMCDLSDWPDWRIRNLKSK